MLQNKTDIIIIGGGIAGCITAISLAPFFSVTLIDKLSEPKDKIGESLAPAANRIFAELDLTTALERFSPPLFKKNLGMQSYWGSDQLHIVDHINNPDGFVKSLNRKGFEQFLRKEAINRGVNCLWATVLNNAAYDSEKKEWTIHLRSTNENKRNQTFISPFVIDASGRQAHFARNIGIKRHIDDKLLACWMSFPNKEENTMSTISSSPNGWWYSAVLPNNRRVMAFHTDSDLIDKSILKSTDSFLALAKENKQIKKLLPTTNNNIIFNGTTAANSTKLEKVAGQQWVALGDAAISFDPLSSQGMFNAMANAMQLRALILQFGFTHELSQSYTQQIEQIWLHYKQHKTIFYSAETRWKTADFWKRRNKV